MGAMVAERTQVSRSMRKMAKSLRNIFENNQKDKCEGLIIMAFEIKVIKRVKNSNKIQLLSNSLPFSIRPAQRILKLCSQIASNNLIFMQLDQENLNQYMKALITQQKSSVKTIEVLKFKNQLYRSGDNVALQHNNKEHEMIARIVMIAQVPRWQFPVLLVAWYFNREESLVQHVRDSLSPRELILSHYVDWQFMEALRGKIQVLSEEDFRLLEWRERSGVYFCRSWFQAKTETILPQGSRYCHCLKGTVGDNNLETCFVCGIEYHSSCSGSSQVCSSCQNE